MTLVSYDESLSELDPIEIYQFSWGSASQNIRRYTSSSLSVVVDFDSNVFAGSGTDGKLTFNPETIKRNEVEMSGDMNRSVIQISATKNNEIAGLFLSGTPSFPINVKIWRIDSEAVSTTGLAIFQGRVTSCSFSGFGASLNCEPIFTQIQKAGLRRYYEPSCSHSLYDKNTCRKSPEFDDVTITGFTFNTAGGIVVSAASGFVTTTPAEGKTAHYTGGYVRIVRNGLDNTGTLHLIANHVGSTLTLTRAIPKNEQVGITSIIVYPGCDHTAKTCQDKFNNIVNFGGFPFMQSINPFVGTRVPIGTS